jgi:hypothetical protein
VLSCALSGGAAAQAQMVTAQNPASVVEALQSAGYQAELTKDKSGDPMIRSNSSGTSFAVLFYGCDKNVQCKSVQFYSGYSDAKVKDLAAMNKWNIDMRFGRAYIDNENDPCVVLDVNLDDGGMSRGLFVDNLEYWVAIMAGFEKVIYAR